MSRISPAENNIAEIISTLYLFILSLLHEINLDGHFLYDNRGNISAPFLCGPDCYKCIIAGLEPAKNRSGASLKPLQK